MAQLIQLQAIPNQTLNIQLDGLLYQITIKAAPQGFMYADVIRSNSPIVLGMRAVNGTYLIPYKYLESGNFLFVTANEEYPYYTQFEVSQFLLYVPQNELESYRV